MKAGRDARRGVTKPQADFVRTRLVDNWRDSRGAVDATKITLRDFPDGLLPRGIELLTAGVDVQHTCLVVVVVGWGLTDDKERVRCYGVQARTIQITPKQALGMEGADGYV